MDAGQPPQGGKLGWGVTVIVAVLGIAFLLLLLGLT